MDEKSHDQQTDEGQVKAKKSSMNDYFAAEKEEEAWLERMKAAAQAQKAKEEAEKKGDS